MENLGKVNSLIGLICFRYPGIGTTLTRGAIVVATAYGPQHIGHRHGSYRLAIMDTLGVTMVQATKVKRLCKTYNSITVNGQFRGPTLEVNNGDTLVIHVTNKARYNVTIHWHGVRRMTTTWANGPEFIRQCPIRPGASYTYRFTISGQEGTLLWHAYSSWLRATVYVYIIIHPREEYSYPFPKPKREAVIALGKWLDANPIDVIREATRTGEAPDVSDVYTINGQPSDSYNSSSKDTVIIPVESGETNLLRVINSARVVKDPTNRAISLQWKAVKEEMHED
ncbi:laccase-12-like protein [Tanacetum coccineum]